MEYCNHLLKTFVISLCLWFSTLHAQISVDSTANDTNKSTKILPARAVFIPSVVQVSDNSIDLRIDIKSGYYIYRTRLLTVSATDIHLTDRALSPGVSKTDAYFGEQSVWLGGDTPAEISVRYDNPKQLRHAELLLRYQGCQDDVICYPPQTVRLAVDLPIATAFTAATSDLFGQRQANTTNASSFIGSAPQPVLSRQSASTALLSETEAFPFSIEVQDAGLLTLQWRIADGYYLYRDKLQVSAKDLSAPDAPPLTVALKTADGEWHEDDFFGKQMIFRGNLTVANVYLNRPAEQLQLNVQFQGCADVGVCYPVMHRTVTVDNGFVGDMTVTEPITNHGTVTRLTETLRNNLWVGIGLLLLAGVALALTPCVLPMLPILLGIITSQRQVGKVRATVLSCAYALGVAVMMAVFGLVVAKTGVNLQIIFQKPQWLLAFAAIFITMGLAMSGMFSIAVPSRIQSRIMVWQNRFQDASLSHLFVVGALSTLVVGPCVAPPLIAILAFISTTGDSALGAIYLFSLGLGMSLPLVVFAALSTGIPKTGALSRLVTQIFSMLMFGVGLWLLGRLLPGALNLALWGVFLIVFGGLFWRSQWVKPYAKRLSQGIAAFAFAAGAAWLTGAALGNSNPLKPFTTVLKLPFHSVSDRQTLQYALANSEQPVMLDLYADWCVSCQEVEHITFADNEVAKVLADFTLLKLDITESTAANQALLRELNLIGPPALLFFNGETELQNQRHIGVIKPAELLRKLSYIKQNNK